MRISTKKERDSEIKGKCGFLTLVYNSACNGTFFFVLYIVATNFRVKVTTLTKMQITIVNFKQDSLFGLLRTII